VDNKSTAVNLRRGVSLALMDSKNSVLNETIGDRYQTGASARKPKPAIKKWMAPDRCQAIKHAVAAASTRNMLMIDDENEILGVSESFIRDGPNA
jgi:hypothetical protein